jgi:hypothetical protein
MAAHMVDSDKQYYLDRKGKSGISNKKKQELNKKNKKICRKSETTDKCQDLKTRPAGSS